ncbi:MAG: hypothetical protein DWQ01_20400 [Planctomycetota bacterium]|nr:MAG: hypothetical protein DWQ01_20400 [Planctomycetota bacterium]
MFSLRKILLLGLLLLLARPVAAQVDLSQMVTFGDSLTNNEWGRPLDLYGADPFEAAFLKAAQAGDNLSNYAVPGSQSVHLHLQVDLYEFFLALGSQRAATLYGLEIGGNDFLANVSLLGAHPPGSHADADAVVGRLLTNLRVVLRDLQQLAPQAHFVLWTVPDITLTPALIHSLSSTEIDNIRSHLDRANRSILNLAQDPGIAVVPLFRAMQQAIPNPPVLFGHALQGPPVYGEYDALFADSIHPTAVGNALIANGILNTMNRKWLMGFPYYSRGELADFARIPH